MVNTTDVRSRVVTATDVILDKLISLLFALAYTTQLSSTYHSATLVTFTIQLYQYNLPLGYICSSYHSALPAAFNYISSELDLLIFKEGVKLVY